MSITTAKFKFKFACFISKLPFVQWANSVAENKIIQIFEGDGETAKSWHLKNRCHGDCSQPQSLQKSTMNTDDFVYPVTAKSELRPHPDLLDLPSWLLNKVVRIERLDDGVLCIVFSHGGARQSADLRIKRLQQSMNGRLSR